MTSDAHLDRVETDRGARVIGSTGSAEVGLSEPSEASSGDQPVALRIRLDAGQSSDGNEDALEAGREIDEAEELPIVQNDSSSDNSTNWNNSVLAETLRENASWAHAGAVTVSIPRFENWMGIFKALHATRNKPISSHRKGERLTIIRRKVPCLITQESASIYQNATYSTTGVLSDAGNDLYLGERYDQNATSALGVRTDLLGIISKPPGTPEPNAAGFSALIAVIGIVHSRFRKARARHSI